MKALRLRQAWGQGHARVRLPFGAGRQVVRRGRVRLNQAAVLAPVAPPAVASGWLGVSARVSDEDGQPSQDLRDLCSLQLGVLQTLLRSTSETPHTLRAAVYLRVYGPDAPSGTVLLQRVAAMPAGLMGGGSRLTHQQQHEDASEGGSRGAGTGGGMFVGEGLGGVGGLSGGQHSSVIALQLGGDSQVSSLSSMGDRSDIRQAESCLVTEEVLVLPSSGSLVLPLVDGSNLVGLMLVEPAVPPATHAPPRAPHQPDQQQQQEALGSGGFMPLMLGDCCQQQQQQGSYASLMSLEVDQGSRGGVDGQAGMEAVPQPPSVSILPANHMHKPVSTAVTTHLPLADGHFITPGPAGIPTALINTYAGFSDEEIHALRVVAPLLAKACAMELRSVVRSAASSAQAAAASRLLREAARPASTLNTFSAMLLPRMEQGSADRDLVKGIASQGKRLQELLRQLDAALAPPPPHPAPLSRPPTPLTPLTPLNASGAGEATLVSMHGRERVQPALPQGSSSQGWAAAAAPPAGDVPQSAALTRPMQPMFTAPSLQQPSSGSAGFSGKQPEGRSDFQPWLAGPDAARQQQNSQAANQTASQTAPSSHASPHSDASGVVTVVSPDLFQLHPSQVAHASTHQAATSPAGSALPAASPHQTATPGVSGTAASPGPDQPTTSAQPGEPRTFIMRLAADSTMAADGVIDMEPVAGPTTQTPSSSPGRADVGARARRPASSQKAPAPVLWGPTSGQGAGGVGVAAVSGGGQLKRPGGVRVLAGGGTPGTDLVPALVPVLTSAAKLAQATDIHFTVYPPLQTALQPATPINAAPGEPPFARSAAAAAAAAQQGSGGLGHSPPTSGLQPSEPADVVPQLKPRPLRGGAHRPDASAVGDKARPHSPPSVHVGVPASTLHRIVAYVVDLALQCTPFGGMVSVSAQQGLRWVELIVAHTGQMAACGGLASPVQQLTQPRLVSGPGLQQQAASAVHVAGSGGVAQLVGRVQEVQQVQAQAGAPLVGAGLMPGGGLLSFAMAEELVLRVGGRVTCEQGVVVHHAGRGTMEAGTRVVIQLPCAPVSAASSHKSAVLAGA